ncbi:RICIN domain-containing protein [Actinacidiphila rubida]|uniref:Ricin B lectin domain-containing protein n=1 Tax=Actinacidiphila rubida TaxID=310780 RepID=A0A1H8KYS0_9ACTN|nr:RICIN domain-containing protein [Actinacidiphila rubida]SEN98052.1 hypothetical protein SAMN05216267_1014154 [Actinacidiphila rubida]
MSLGTMAGVAAGVAVLVVAGGAVAGAADAGDLGTYRIREAGSNRCVAPNDGLMGARLDSCGASTWWTLRAVGDGTVRFVVEGADGERCLGLSPAPVAPAALWLSACGASPDTWTVEGARADGRGPLTLRLAAAPLASLAPVGGRAALGGDGSPMWVLQPAG